VFVVCGRLPYDEPRFVVIGLKLLKLFARLAMSAIGPVDASTPTNNAGSAAVVDDKTQKLKENKTQLENKLLSRLTKQELLEKRILLSEAAPSLHSAQSAVAAKLEMRPTTEELRQKNIWKGDKNVSPQLIDAQTALERKKKEDDIGRKLASRPTVQDLVEQHILVKEVEGPGIEGSTT